MSWSPPYSVRYVQYTISGGTSQVFPTVPDGFTFVMRDVHVVATSPGLAFAWELDVVSGDVSFPLEIQSVADEITYSYHEDLRTVLYPGESTTASSTAGAPDLTFNIMGYLLNGYRYFAG